MILEIIIPPQKHGLHLYLQVSANCKTYSIYHTALGQMIYETGSYRLLTSSTDTEFPWEKRVIKMVLQQIDSFYPVYYLKLHHSKIQIFTTNTPS